MSARYLGEVFDIHAGGLDLIFPHHENEIAQSCCAHGTDAMARYWVHNGYVTVEGEKMSKSLGNFTTVQDALSTHRGEVIRYALLAAHYRAPLDFSAAQSEQAQRNLDKLYRIVADVNVTQIAPDDEFLRALGDDMNTPLALARLHKLASAAQQGDTQAAALLKSSAALLGLLQDENWFGASQNESDEISQLVRERDDARAARDFARADEIRDLLDARNIRLLDGPDGTRWEKG
jgi:cysteinyl-tRNA synthetase